MILLVESDTTYLVIPNAKSKIAGYFQLNHYIYHALHLSINRVILVKYKALKYIVLSIVEAETVDIFHNVQDAVPIYYILE